VSICVPAFGAAVLQKKKKDKEMINMPNLSCVLGLILATSTAAGILGEYSPAAVTNKEVIAAAKFAVSAKEEAMREEKNPKPARLKLVKIVSAQQQVVAGINFRLYLELTLNGNNKEAKAIVWWQAWRRPDSYQLTSWKWKENGKQNKPDANDGK